MRHLELQNMPPTASTEPETTETPVSGPARLELHLRRLRLLLERHIAWLRLRWKQDPLQTYGTAVISDAQADSYLQPQNSEAEARFYREDPAARGLGERIRRIDRALAEPLQGQPSSELERVVQLFRLTPFERDVLILCLAPEIDPGFEALYGYVQDDASRRHATPALALALFAPNADACASARKAFAPSAPLRDFGLVQISPGSGGSLSMQAVRLDERLVHLLTGTANELDPALLPALRPLEDAPLAPTQDALVTRLAGLVAAGEVTAINLVGRPGGGRHAIAAALGRRVGLNLLELGPTAIPIGEPERRDWMRRLEREAILLSLGFYLRLDDPGSNSSLSADTQDRLPAAAMTDLVESLRAFLIIGSRERYSTRRPVLTASVPPLDAASRRTLWRSLTEASDETLEALVQQFELGPRAMAQAVGTARDLARLESGSASSYPDAAHLWRACREQAARALQDLGRRLAPWVGWEDLVLPEDSLAQLREIAAQVAHRAQVYDGWGFGARLSRGRGICALFAGPSGTGKTLAAEVLARHLDLDLFRIDLSGIVSKYIGETEKNLRRVFDAAEASGAILFFDEADALFGKRSEVKDSHDRYANIEINYLLQRMEDYRGLAILATNMRSHLDPAFLRRLRFVVEMPFPDADIRKRIWQRVFPDHTPTLGLDFDALARLEVTGGNIKNIALNAAFMAAAAGSPVRMEHLLHAARREYQKLEKMLPPGDFSLHPVRGRA